MFSRLLRKQRFAEYRNERSFLVRNINELERRKKDAQLHLDTNNKNLAHLDHISVFTLAENRYWENEILKLDIAIEENYEQLRELTRKNREYVNAI